MKFVCELSESEISVRTFTSISILLQTIDAVANRPFYLTGSSLLHPRHVSWYRLLTRLSISLIYPNRQDRVGATQDINPALLLHSLSDGHTGPIQKPFPKFRILLHHLSTLWRYGFNISQTKFLIYLCRPGIYDLQ